MRGEREGGGSQRGRETEDRERETQREKEEKDAHRCKNSVA
jgi:hypothetical protein